MDRILRAKPATLETSFLDAAGDQVDAGDVTITITRDDGTDIVTDAATTKNDADPDNIHYTFDLDAAQTGQVDRLTATWTSTSQGTNTTYVEVVGGFYASLASIRALPGLSDDTKFSDDDLRRERAEVETRIEVATGQAWVPRYGAETHLGNGRDTLQLARIRPTSILSATETDANGDETTLNTSGWILDPTTGTVERDSSRFSKTSRYRIRYEHGQAVPPSDLRRAALSAIRMLLLEDGGLSGSPPSRATSMDTEYGSYRLQMADTEDRPFGHHTIDSVVMRHADGGPVLASDTLLDITPLG